MSSATRYRTWPRFIAVLAAQPAAAPRAARTASRRSLREARHALARVAPSAPVTTYDRPLSLLGNAPPMYSLYVLRTSIRDADGLSAPRTGTRSRVISDPPGAHTRAARACRPRARTPTPCSHRTARLDRTG